MDIHELQDTVQSNLSRTGNPIIANKPYKVCIGMTEVGDEITVHRLSPHNVDGNGLGHKDNHCGNDSAQRNLPHLTISRVGIQRGEYGQSVKLNAPTPLTARETVEDVLSAGFHRHCSLIHLQIMYREGKICEAPSACVMVES